MADQELPSPPVPPLAPTLQRFVEGVKAVVPDSQVDKLAAAFGNTDGPKLQALLETYATTVGNWVTPLWLDDMYLRNPAPLPVNSNPFFLLPKLQGVGPQSRLAARVIHFSLLFRDRVHNGNLSPDTASGHGKGVPLCMQTYRYFFTACRIPGDPVDRLEILDSPSEHIVVAHRGQLHVVEWTPGKVPTVDTLTHVIDQIVQSGDPQCPPVGVLTSLDRRVWARIRQDLVSAGAENADNLKKIETSLGVVCLDPAPLGDSLEAKAEHLLHGGGAKVSGANRWYDKFFEVVLAGDGTCGVLAEHSASEGMTVLRFCQELMEFLKEGRVDTQVGPDAKVQWRTLRWKLTPRLTTEIQQACKSLDKLADDLDLMVVNFSNYGKNFIKSRKTSPDVWVQLALQLTYFTIHGQLTSTYESASLRQFHDGRVDNIRAATPEALAWVKAVVSDGKDVKKLFSEAVQKQTEVLVYTIRGYGPDNHIVGLREMARLQNIPEPKFFQDDLYKLFWDFKLSTSQLATSSGTLVGYGPVVPDGYGCSYTILENEMVFCVTTFRSCADTQSELFAHTLQTSLDRMPQL